MVLKTGPDRPVKPVQPGTGVWSGSVLLKNRKIRKSDQNLETGSSIGQIADRYSWTDYESVQLFLKIILFYQNTPLFLTHAVALTASISAQSHSHNLDPSPHMNTMTS